MDLIEPFHYLICLLDRGGSHWYDPCQVNSENKFGGESVTYEGIGSTKKWERLESYGPKFVENVVQAVSRDLLMNAMKNLPGFFICGHVHDELIIECKDTVSLDEVRRAMAHNPSWMPDILLRADGYTTEFYKKD